MGTTTRSRGTSIPRTANSYGDEPNDSGDDSAPAFRRIRERRGARRHEEERLPRRVVDVAGAVRRRLRQPRRGGGRRECAPRADGHLVRGARQDRLRAGLVPPRRFGPAHACGMAEHPRSDPGPMDREETARPEGRGGLIPTGDFQLGEPYLPSSDAADRARMSDEAERDEAERDVRFDGATARLRGRRPVVTPSSSRDVASAHGPRWPPRPTSSAPERSSWASATRDNRNGGWPWSASRSSRSPPWSWWDSSRTGPTCLCCETWSRR